MTARARRSHRPIGDPWARRDVLRVLGLSAAGISLGGLGACGSDGSSAGSTGGATSSTTAAAIAAAQSPRFDPDVDYWNQGNFAPVTTEETITDLSVTGTIPSELSGLYVRNGSNAQGGTTAHWFLGDGMLHGVRIEDGKAQWYRNRYVRTPFQESGKDTLSFGGPPGTVNNQSNVAVVHHAGKLLSTGEVGWPYELDPTDLSTVGAWDFAGRLGPTMTAHPKIDPDTGRMHFFGYEFLSPKLTYYAAAPDGTLDVVSPIAVDAATMIHDFAITDRHAVFWIGPVVFDISELDSTGGFPFVWDPSGPSKVGVMALDGSGDEIRWADAPLGFAFHGLNAHAEGDDLVVNLHRLPEAFGPRGEVSSHLTEWRIGTGGTDLAFLGERRVSDREMDLPTIDRRWTGRKNRHGWCATTTTPKSEYGFELNGICHVDLQTGTEDVWDPGATRRAGEGFFVPAGKGEGEGYVMTYIWDRTTDRSSLAIFDAQAMANGPVAEVQLPVRVPFGFHGLWVDEADL